MDLRITVTEVLDRLRRGDPIVLVDARSPSEWGAAATMLPGAIRIPPDDVERHVAELPRGRPIVAYCT